MNLWTRRGVAPMLRLFLPLRADLGWTVVQRNSGINVGSQPEMLSAPPMGGARKLSNANPSPERFDAHAKRDCDPERIQEVFHLALSFVVYFGQ
jgi:hypothetical protein